MGNGRGDGVGNGSVGGNRCRGLGGPLHVLEGAGGMAAQAAFGIEDAGFRERERGRAVQELAPRHQRPAGRLHEAGLHLDRDHADVGRYVAAGRDGHGDIHEGHRGAAVGDAEGIQVVRLRGVVQFGFSALHMVQGEAEVADKGNFGAEAQHEEHSIRIRGKLPA